MTITQYLICLSSWLIFPPKLLSEKLPSLYMCTCHLAAYSVFKVSKLYALCFHFNHSEIVKR